MESSCYKDCTGLEICDFPCPQDLACVNVVSLEQVKSAHDPPPSHTHMHLWAAEVSKKCYLQLSPQEVSFFWVSQANKLASCAAARTSLAAYSSF